MLAMLMVCSKRAWSCRRFQGKDESEEKLVGHQDRPTLVQCTIREKKQAGVLRKAKG